MSIAPLTRTSEPFRYHDRVVGDIWLRRAPATETAAEGPRVFTQRAAWLHAWTLAIGTALLLSRAGLPRLVTWGYLAASLLAFVAWFPFRQLP